MEGDAATAPRYPVAVRIGKTTGMKRSAGRCGGNDGND
jgi:hypothetical protein